MALRTPTLLVGPIRLFGRRIATVPYLSISPVVTPDARFSIGIRSGCGSSSQSTSPAVIALADGRIRNDPPLHAIQQHLMAAGGVRGGLLPWLIFVKSREAGVAARHKFIGDEAEGAAADDLRELLEWIGCRETSWHDHRLGLHL